MIFGAIQGLVNGTEQVVFDSEVVGGDVTSIATGNILNGDEDGWYTVIFRHIGPGDQVASLRFNSDANTNYGYRGVYAGAATAGNASATGANGIYFANPYVNGQTSFSVARIFAKSGSVRLVNFLSVDQVTGTTCTYLYAMGQVWNNSADNITSMTMVTPSSGMKAGTRLIILKSNNFTNGMPTGIITTPYIKGSWVRLPGSGVIVSSTNSVAITTDGDRDVIYKIAGQIISATATDSYYTLKFNTDTGANYGQQLMNGQNTTVSAIRETGLGAIKVANNTTTGNNSFFEYLLFAKSGFLRPMIGQYHERMAGTTVNNVGLRGQVWNNTGNNLTTITLLGDQANSIGANSQFEIYALRPNG